MKIGVYQNYPQFGKKEENTALALTELSDIDADLMVLPELFNTGYQFVSKEEAANLAEEIPDGITCRAMAELARKRGTFLVFGLAEKDGGRLYNSAVVIGPDGLIGTYRKTHLFDEEKLFFSPGDTGFRIFDIGKARIGVMICFDWWFPEAARTLAIMGADIICHPANLVLQGCQQAMKTRSLENGVFSATANRIGVESRGGKTALTFTGRSQILNCTGELMTALERDRTGISIVQIDVLQARDKTIGRQNNRFLDRRPEFYGPVTKE